MASATFIPLQHYRHRQDRGYPIATRHLLPNASDTGAVCTGPSCLGSNISNTGDDSGTDCDSGVDDGFSTGITGVSVCSSNATGRDTIQVGTGPRNPGAAGPLGCRRKGAATPYVGLFLVLTRRGTGGPGYSPSPGGQQGSTAIAATVAQGLGIQVKEVVEDADPMVDILNPSRPARIALPLTKSISDTTKNFVADPSLIAPYN